MGSGKPARQFRIAVFDDHGEIRDALERRLATDPRVAAVASAAASDTEAIPDVIQRLNPNVVLFDPGRGGVHTPGFRTLLARRGNGEFAIALHVVHPDEQGRASALAAGCDLYISKGMRTTALLDLLASRAPSRWDAESDRLA